MGRDATKAAGNPWYQARKKAAEYDDRLCSRESAAEQLGMSVSSLADAELGNTKFMPVDKAVLMADRYNAPWLLNHYPLIATWLIQNTAEKGGAAMSKAVGFHIDVKPVSVTFTCPHCGREVTVPWRELDVPECWGDDWGYVECPDCETEVKLGDYEYD